MDKDKKFLTPKSVDLPRWYTEVIQNAEIAEYGPVRGTMIIRPYGYAIWEFVQNEFNKRIQEKDVENAYFPMFIPMHLLKKEKEHVEGFAPELAVVTHGGGEKLEEPLVIRPTSETIMYEMYSKWISSWRDLPLKLNQWCNVVRWEKRTYFFLRTLEFLWQEGHTAHATYEEAEEMALWALKLYQDFYKEIYALPGLIGIKSSGEKFAGAAHTYSIELLMPDGKILQGATSHHLGDNFAKVFKITFQDKEGKTNYVQQTSWGISTRSLGGLFLIHGDDKGLVLPPRLAPIKALIVPVLGKKDKEILKYCEKIKSLIEKTTSIHPGKVVIDEDSEKTLGWKLNNAELKGIPLKIVVGTREMEEGVVCLSFRLAEMDKVMVRISEIGEKVEENLLMIQEKMYEKAKKDLDENIYTVKDYDQFKKVMETSRGFIKAFWCENPECELKIKEETKANTRFMEIDTKEEKGKCIYCRKEARHIWYFGQPY